MRIKLRLSPKIKQLRDEAKRSERAELEKRYLATYVLT